MRNRELGYGPHLALPRVGKIPESRPKKEELMDYAESEVGGTDPTLETSR